MNLAIKQSGATNLMAHLCRVGHMINKMVTWDEKQCKSPGTLITALIVNILGQKSPLYRVNEVQFTCPVSKPDREVFLPNYTVLATKR